MTAPAIERRTAFGSVEFRQEDDRLQARGYAAVFNSPSQDLGGFVEVILPGAFRDVVKTDDVRALWNHDPNHVLGRVGAGTLRLGEDDKGLWYEVDLPDTTTGRDVATLLARGDVIGSSFGFRVLEDGAEWRVSEDGRPLREIRTVARLRDVGPVTFPAYLATEAYRSLAESRSLDVDEVRSAAERGDLARIISSPPVPYRLPQHW